MITIQCHCCSERHELFYQRQSNGTLHMLYKHDGHARYVPLVEGLALRFTPTKREQNLEALRLAELQLFAWS